MMQALLVLAFVGGQAATLLFPGAHWSFLDVFAVLASILFIAHLFGHRERSGSGVLLRDICLFGVLALGITIYRSLMLGGNWWPDMTYIARWLAYAGVYAWVTTVRQVFPWKKTLYLSGLVFAAVGLLQVSFYPDLRNLMYLGWDPHFHRLFATLFDPNFAGIVLVLIFILGCSFWDRVPRVTLGVTQLVVLVSLLLTYSRSSYLALLVGFGIWVWSRRAYAVLWGFLVAFLVTAIFLLPHSGEGRDLLRSVSTQARLGSTVVGLRQIAASPIIGTGFSHDPASRAGSVDASLVYIVSSMGLIGGVGYVWILFGTAALAVIERKRFPKDALLLSSLGAVLVHSLFINSLFYPWVMLWLWILLAGTEYRLRVGT